MDALFTKRHGLNRSGSHDGDYQTSEDVASEGHSVNPKVV
jgi:hypothetical protein